MNPTRYSLTKQPRNKTELAKKQRGERWKGTWYVRYKLPDGKWSPLKSTGCANKSDAIAKLEAETGPVLGKDTRLDEFTLAFFDYPNGRYITDRRAGGHRASYRSAMAHRTNLEHIKRVLGNPRLRDIDKTATKRLRDTLYAEGRAASTINHVINCLSIVLDAAEDDGIIPAVPKVYRAGGKGSAREVLTVSEARLVLNSKRWRDERERIANVVAAATGLRQGEILGLTRDRVHRDHLDVSQVWDRVSYRLKPATKNGESRVVPISKRVRRELARLIHMSPHRPKWYVFYHDASTVAPYNAAEVTRGLKHVLRAEGIDVAATFHSWRHYANSRMIEAGVPAETVRALIGHRSEGMTMNYYRPGEVAAIVSVQDE